MRLLLLFALVVAAQADIGRMRLECPQIDGQEWELYRGSHEASCMHMPKSKKTFTDAFKECFKFNATLVTLAHKKAKIEFVNKLVIKSNPEATIWYFNPQFLHPKLNPQLTDFMKDKMMDNMSQKEKWTVMEASKDPTKVKLIMSPAPIARNYMCERQALPVPQRPKFAREPEDLQIGQDDIDALVPQNGKTPRPLFATFNCRAFALPKPDVHWVMVRQTNETLEVKDIKVTKITNIRQALRRAPTELTFFDLRRDCRARPCAQNGIQEPSQLIVVGYEAPDAEFSIACVANNSIGRVISREAKIIVAKMETNEKAEEVEVFEGHNVTLPCNLETTPDVASVEWVRKVMRPGMKPRVQTLEEINVMTYGSYQQSKRTFDLIIDAADPKYSGHFECRVRMHSLRVRHMIRKQVVLLKVKKCKDKEQCGFEKRQLEVVPGYPTALSLSPKSNKYIRQGDDFLLECPCLGKRNKRDEIEVQWELPTTVKTPAIVDVRPTGSVMKVAGASEKMNGTYSCRCKRREKKEREWELSAWSSMEVSIVPYIAPTNHVEVVEAQIGKEARLECKLPEIKMDDIMINLTPMRGDRSVYDVMPSDRFELGASNGLYTITIKKVQPEDAGNYGCRIRVNYFDEWETTDNFYTTLKVLQSN